MALALFVFASLLAVAAGGSKEVSAQATPVDGFIIFEKICVGDDGSAITSGGAFTIDVDVEIFPEIFQDTTVDEDDFFDDTLAAVACGGVGMYDARDLVDWIVCNTDIEDGDFNDEPVFFPGDCEDFCDQWDLTTNCGVPDATDVTVALSELGLPAGVTAAFGGDCAGGMLDLINPDSVSDGDFDPDATATLFELAFEGLVCTVTNTYDLPTLTITKNCPSGPGTGAFTVGVTGPEAVTGGPIVCGGSITGTNLTTGSYTITETVTGTSVYSTVIVCSNGSTATGIQGASVTTSLVTGTNVTCTIYNVLDTTPGTPPDPPVPGSGGNTITVGPITIAIPIAITTTTTNTNTNNNTTTNNNSTTNNNTTTNTNSNSQTQTNAQHQSSGQDQDVNAAALAPVRAGVLAATAPVAPVAGFKVSPPNTGDGGLVDASNGSSWTLFAGIAGVFALTLAAGYAFKRGN